MSWGDILYPDNPSRRAEVERKSQELIDLMESNFRATNDLIDLLNEHSNKKIARMELDTTSRDRVTINANAMVKKMGEVQEYIKSVDDDLSKTLDPELYKKLHAPDLDFQEQLQIANKTITVISGISATIVTGIVAKLVASRLVGVIERAVLRIVASTLVGAVAGGILGLAVEIIAGAITGAIERDKLTDAISQLESALAEFKPDSIKYTDTIVEVRITVKVFLKHNQP